MEYYIILSAIILTSCMSIYALASSRKRIRHLQEDLAKANYHRETLVGHLAHYDELREQMLDDRFEKMAKDAIASGFNPPEKIGA